MKSEQANEIDENRQINGIYFLFFFQKKKYNEKHKDNEQQLEMTASSNAVCSVA